MYFYRGIGRAPCYLVTAKPAVLSVFPGAFLSIAPLASALVVIHAVLSSGMAINEKVPVCLVVDDGTGARVQISGVADIVAVEMEVVSEKKPYLALLPPQVLHLDLLDIHVQVYVDHVGAAELKAQGLVLEQDGDDLTLVLPFHEDVLSEDVSVYAGCDHTIATCLAKFANDINFGGCPYVPTKNIFITGVE